MGMVRSLILCNIIMDSRRGDCCVGSHLTARPGRRAMAVDLAGYTLWPALINTHDHLALNHYPRSRFRPVYENAHQWGEDVDARLGQSPYREGQAVPLADRLFIGGLKNLLCGALTVAHHNPLHRSLRRADFPVRVLRRYGWAHSLHFEPDVVATYHRTGTGVPWFIHLAEGTDAVAAAEYRWLREAGCAEGNTVLVHGVGLTDDDAADAAGRVRGLVWCPSSNRYLLGATADVARWRALGGRTVLGSDSRLTADGDLLDEMRTAVQTTQVDDACIQAMVTTEAAALLGIMDVGRLSPGQRADLILMREGRPLVGARRADLSLVMRGGVPLLGDPAVMARFSHVPTCPATLDGRPKLIHGRLARRILKNCLQEPGLVIAPQPAAPVEDMNHEATY